MLCNGTLISSKTKDFNRIAYEFSVICLGSAHVKSTFQRLTHAGIFLHIRGMGIQVLATEQDFL